MTKNCLVAAFILLLPVMFAHQSASAQITYSFTSQSIVPEITASPESIIFGNVHIGGDDRTRELTIQNSGTEPLIIDGIAISGVWADDYAVSPESYDDPILPDSSVVFFVTITPPNEPGYTEASIDFSSNGGMVSVPVIAQAQESGVYYVSTLGSNNNPGTRIQPWRTVQYAVDVAIPGDTILVENGTYQGPVIMTRSGDPDAYITLRAVNRHGAIIEVQNGLGPEDGIKAAANYLTIDGFELYDVAPGIGHLGNGVTVYNNHHVNILNNIIHDFGGSGIQASHFDHVLIENNIVYDNAKYNPNQSSGISLFEAIAVDDAPGYHAIVRNNRSFGNINLVTKNGRETFDGNGILVDEFWNSVGSEPTNIFPHRTLIENNLAYDNGGKGIQVYRSNYVDIFNNTAFHNNHDEQNLGTWRGELSLISSDGTVWRNNIGVSNPGEGILEWNRAILISKGGDTVWENNITFNGTEEDISILIDNFTLTEEYLTENNLMGIDPLFMDVDALDFSLQLESPAINAGSDDVVSFIDINYLERNVGTIDIGAFEFDEDLLPVELTSFDAVVSETNIQLAWSTASELNNAGFAVELRAAGRDYEQVLFVEGRGTTDMAQEYAATLSAILPGTYMVRLKQIDFDGTFAYSDAVEVLVGANSYHLGQSYPNPFNPQTRIQYILPVANNVTLEVYDLLGRSIRTLINEVQPAGNYSVIFDGTNLSNGTYVYRITAGEFVETKSMVLLK